MTTNYSFIFFLWIFFLGLTSSAQQNWLWSNGGNGNDEALANATDINGNIFTTGYFSLSAGFDTTVYTSSGSGDIFVSKQNSLGQYQWTVKAGGAFSDRAYGISTDVQGNVFITGFFSGTATFGLFSLTSVSASLDVFVAKLDTAGTFLWAKSFGGSDIDIGLDLHVDPFGEAIVTGQFRSTAQFGNFSFTSMNDTAGRPSYDLFIMKLDTAGNVIWARQGAAKFDDRGLAVSTDALGNIYFTGQYSDTLTLGAVYPNISRSVSFLAKMDSAGNMIWMRQMLATQVVVYSVQCLNNNVYMSGDFQGQLAIFGTTVTYLNKPFLYKIFVAKLDSAGTVAWASCDGSDNPVSALGMTVDNNGGAYLAGTFNCTMTEYSALYGAGIFNSVGYRDVFITKFDSAGTRQYERQFAGPGDDYCSAICVSAIDHPVIAGSFEGMFNVPDGGSFTLNHTDHDSVSAGPDQSPALCGDNNYNKYVSLVTDGNKDVFSSRPLDLSRQPYDYFDRDGASGCIRDSLLPLINYGLDTLVGCDSVRLFANRRTGRDAVIGPAYDYRWSNGSVDSTIRVTTSGRYYLHMDKKDNCRRYDDSVFVKIFTTPPIPNIATTIGTIRTAIPDTPCTSGYNKLIVVFPDTATLFCTNAPSGYVTVWNTPYGTFITDSVQTLQSGAYEVTVMTPNGLCLKSNCISVIIYIQGVVGHCLPANFVPEIHFTDSAFEASDTVRVCKNEFFNLVLIDSTDWANGDTIDFIPTYVDWQITGGYEFVLPLSCQTTFCYHFQRFKADSSGWCTVTAYVEDPINGTTLYVVTKNFYLDVLPLPPLLGHWHGPIFYCPGDTVLLTVTGGNSYSINGPGIVWQSLGNDSIKVTQPGIFNCHYIVTDTSTGCSSIGDISFDLQTIPAPRITMIPSNGVVCPGDSVELIAENGTNYTWSGPLGNIIGHTQTIYVTAPGDYHYDFTDTLGCTLVSEFKEIKLYSTPYLIASPAAMICPGGSVTISVSANDSSIIQWQSPLSGNSLNQTISVAGSYTCNITSCGITTSATVTITVDNPVAHIIVINDTLICPGDTVLLQGNSSMAAYQWLPGGSASQSLYVFNAGTYTLMITDYIGCTATDSATIDTITRPPVPLAGNVMICIGDTAILQATASGTVSWYATLTGNPLASGTTFITPHLFNDTTYYVSNYDSVCHSARVPVHVNIDPASLPPLIIADTSVCYSDSIKLNTATLAVGNYHWSGPNGFNSTSQSPFIYPVDTTYSGYYVLQVSDNICSSPVDSIFIRIHSQSSVQIVATDTIICPGTTATLSALQAQSAYLWLPSNGINPTLVVDTTGSYYLVGRDMNGCADTSQLINVALLPAPPQPNINDTSVCIGGSVSLSDLSGFTVNWYDSAMALLTTGSVFTTPNLNAQTTYYVQHVGTTGCRSIGDSVTVFVNPLPSTPILTGDTTYCAGDTIQIISAADTGVTYLWSGPNGFTSTLQNGIISHSVPGDSGIYRLTVFNLGCGNSADYHVIVYPLPSNHIYSHAPVCVGNTLSFSTDTTASAIYSWHGPAGYTSSAVGDSIALATISQSGYYYLEVTSNGCSSGIDSTYLKVVEYPSFNLGNDTVLCNGSTITLAVAAGYDMYQWSSGSITDTLNVSSAGVYSVTVTNIPNCSFADTIRIDTMDCHAFIPNVFTPNGDGYNDYFYVRYERAHDINVIIFDRWGEIIRRLGGNDLKWDGKNERRADVAVGTYYYVVQATNFFGKREEFHGYVELIR